MSADTTICSELNQFYEIRAKAAIKNLERKNMDGYFVHNRQEALELVMSLIPLEAVVGRGDSVTLNQIGIIEELQRRGQNRIINPVETDDEGHHPPKEERRQRQREALLSDVYLTSTNALTLGGSLVNIDGAGNRVAAMSFGPKKVVVIAGGNKIVNDVEEALQRIHNSISIINSLRHYAKHGQAEAIERPCIKLGKCTDCFYEWRVCRHTSIIDGCQPAEKGRISVILVCENLGIS
ncbi:lactate utilization protein [Desulfosporosinus sp. PR]|uniref:lactate utilization protein n=1 Tax=Candidatus Desulfosporosinus nitrosoreducens TaxID=3401928 RepID=UPI0027FDCE0A|nr:lactate utilization protein [Desulfosporosinus sp. PR]MDQ7096522.1 lactate utilization protein [Desulfosporosinus sp. PR]